MLINNNQSGQTFSSGVLDSSTFSFAIDGKAFKIFSDALYQNKPESIVRELCCNALDSHVMSGQPDRQFEVHVPSIFEPYLGIKDFGLGLSHADMKGIYTVLFKSNKDTSNDAIGGFGLGSKTPFSYTDSFTVVSIHNGIKRHYTVMKDATGIPALDLMIEEETDEHNGLEVQMSVEMDDHIRFRNAIQSQLRFFKVKPKLTNISGDFKIQKVEIADDYGKFQTIRNLNGLWVVQGQVGYPLDIAQFEPKIKNKDNLRFFEVYTSGILNFDIGEIEVTVSREGISYSPHTIANIEKFISEVSPLIFKESVDKVKAFKSDWERLAQLNANSTMRGMARLAGMKFGDNGIKDIKVVGGSSNNYQISITHKWKDDALKSQNFTLSNVTNVGKRVHWSSSEMLITPSLNTKIILRDSVKGAIARVKHFAQENYSYNVFLFEHGDAADQVDRVYADTISRMLGGVEVTLTSELPEPPKNSAAKRGTPIVYYNKMVNINTDSIVQWERTYDEEELEKGYFLEFDTYPRLNMKPEESELLYTMVSNKMFDAPIYAVKASKVSVLNDNPKFMNAIDKAKELLNEIERKIIKSELTLKRYKAATAVQGIVSGYDTAFKVNSFQDDDLNRLPKSIEPNRIKRMKKIVNKYIGNVQKHMQTNGGKIGITLFEQSVMKFNVDDAYIVNDIKASFDVDGFMDRYPLLTYVNAGNYYENALTKLDRSKKMADYILLMHEDK